MPERTVLGTQYSHQIAHVLLDPALFGVEKKGTIDQIRREIRRDLSNGHKYDVGLRQDLTFGDICLGIISQRSC